MHPYVGSQLLEFDVFMKYYSWFTEEILNSYMLFPAKIMTTDEMIFIRDYDYRSSYNIIVIKTINQLLSGDANYFYKLLEAIQHRYNEVASIFRYDEVASRDHYNEVASRIQTEIYLWNQKMSTGTFMQNTCIITL